MNSLQRTSSSFTYLAVAWFSYSNKEVSNKTSREFARSNLGIDNELRNISMWIKIQQTQQYADIYLLQNYSTCFGCHSTHHQEY